MLRETGLLPHANPGILDDDELLALRDVCASQGIMLETASARLSQRGGPHFGSPDKLPDAGWTRSTAPGGWRSRRRAAS